MRPEDIEIERLAVQARLDGERSAPQRNRDGQFATPPALAESIVRAALALLDPAAPIRFLDPAIGSGAFFSALLRSVPRERIAGAEGVELDPRFAAAARLLWGAAGLQITAGDFTRLPPPPERRPNLLVANPPYVRHHHLAAEEKRRLVRRAGAELGIAVSGLAGLYAHFLLLSHAWMAEAGVAAWLIPAEWMDVNYGAAVREFLYRVATPLRLHLFDASDVRFGDALVSSSVVFFRRSPPAADHVVRLTAGPSLDQPRVDTWLPAGALVGMPKWSPLLRSGASPRAAPPRATLGDLFTIRRGIATGSNAFFIRERDDFLARGIAAEHLRPVLPPSRRLVAPIVEAAPDGFPLLPRPLALLDCHASETEVRTDHPALWRYLETPDGRTARESYLARGRSPWYSQERRPVAPYLCTYMGRGRNGATPFRFYLNRSRAIATNVYLMLFPKPALAAALAASPGLDEEVLSLLGEISAAGFASHGRVYGGGLHKLEPRELASLPASPIVSAADLSHHLEPGPASAAR